MKNNFKYLLIAMLMLAVFCLQPDRAVALEKVDFAFYYQTIEDTVQIGEDIKKGDSLWTKIKKTGKKVTNWVKRTWESSVTRNITLGAGESLWYSKEDSNLAYKVKRTKVTSEAELLAAMGASSESELSNGQKALLASFRTAHSDAMKKRAKASYLPKVNVILTDTTDFEDKAKYPHVRSDFWPCSTGLTISISSFCYNKPGGDRDAASTMIHEYCHSMDATLKEFINPYGKDGSHYGNEITGKRSAFVEAWAEYNEMIESEVEARHYIENTKELCLESKTEAGSYTKLLPEEATYDQLLAAESYGAYTLYRLAKEIEDGEDKVLKAFTDTRWKIFRDLRTLVKRFVKNNPQDAAKVCQIVDEIYLGKMTDKELMEMCGKSQAVKDYIANRGKVTDEKEELAESESDIEAKPSTEKLNVKTSSGNPFSVQ